MSIGPVPVNQLNALPLLTAAQAASAGELNVIGGTLVRYFGPTALGISGASAQTVNTKVCLVGNYLDLRGTSKYIFTLRCVNPAVRVALPACVLQWQTRMGPTDTPSPSYVQGGTIQDALNAIFNVTSASNIFIATTAANEVQTAIWAFSFPGPTAGGTSLATVIGSDVRPIVSWSTNPVPAANLFTANLWASS